MRKRLRKKLYRGEFQRLCFELEFRFADTTTFAQRDACVDRFIEWIEAQCLQFGGGGDVAWNAVVERAGRETVTESDRLSTVEWLRSQGDIAQADAGPLRDAWYGWS